MKKLHRYLGVPLVVAAFIGTSSVSLAGIKGSKHDLGSGGTAQETTAVTSEVCVFCHTPHGSNTGVSAPLWNKTIPVNVYQRYSSLGTATLDGTEVAVGSVSLACLSCHDGTQAMDVVINAPGSGLGAGGAPNGLDPAAIGAMTGTPVPNLGLDLRNDHPVSIAYAGGGCAPGTDPCTPSTGMTNDKDFKDAQYAALNAQDQWWVDVSTASVAGVADQREKTDMILYTRDFSGTNGPSVECASCHDPHEDAARPVSFLRISNDNSDVCLSCHTK